MVILPVLMALLSPRGMVLVGGSVLDGTGRPAVLESVRIVGDRIVQVGRFKAHPTDKLINVKGLTVAPGFIDAHNHADEGIFEDLNAETQIRQGITTGLVGVDGFSALPVGEFLRKIDRTPASMNFATYVGEGTVRNVVMGNQDRKPTQSEMAKMETLIAQSMKQGAIGLSTGLEYEPNRYASTDEIIKMAKIAAKYHGMYVSHIRNEDNNAFEAFEELITISKNAHLPGEINHIKLCSERVWGRESEVARMMDDARKSGNDVNADVYPYTFWQSTIRVIIPTEDFEDRAQWEQGLKDVGGASHVLLTTYTPDSTWVGKNLAEISEATGKDPITLCQEIVTKCYKSANNGEEQVVVNAMSEDDLSKFIADPHIIFCSDGNLHGTHPRGAGSFPRVLGVFVREKHVISLPVAIHKMTMQAAQRFGFPDRGQIKKGMKADITIFDPATVLDHATTRDPQAKPTGIPMVFVNGKMVLKNGEPTGVHSGVAIRKSLSFAKAKTRHRVKSRLRSRNSK